MVDTELNEVLLEAVDAVEELLGMVEFDPLHAVKTNIRTGIQALVKFIR